MQAGQIIEQGTHQELLEQHGSYANMWTLQQQQQLEAPRDLKAI